MEQFNKYIVLLSLIFFNNIIAQEDKRFFITKDTLVVENPVIISFRDTDGMFLTSENYIRNEKNIDIRKMINENKAYIYSDEFYRFLSFEEFELKPVYNDCPFIFKDESSKDVIVRKLDNTINRFQLCFVRLDFYHKKILTPNHKKINFSKKRNKDFYKIVFPICK